MICKFFEERNEEMHSPENAKCNNIFAYHVIIILYTLLSLEPNNYSPPLPLPTFQT